MDLQEYLKLRNGTDVRGVACEGVEGEEVTLTEEAVANIAKAFCVWLISHTGRTTVTVAVGYDSRITSPTLCDAVVEGILSTGHNAVVTGLSTTPSMFAFLKDETTIDCDGSIMITASHLPFNRNGMKFFSKNGGLEGNDVRAILSLAPDYRFAEGIVGEKTEYPYLDTYAAALVNKVREATGEETPLLGKKIIVDAGNGAGGFFADKVLAPLGADTAGSQFLEPDGNFPNHIPNPENADAMRSICAAVKASRADFGIIFDTDVDRAGAVDKNGEEINRNRLIALISAILLEEHPGSTIVTDSVTSDGLTKFIQAKGGKHHRFKRGYKNVINEALRLNAEGVYTPLAIETSGHAALIENYFLDDGAYLVTRLLIALARAAKEGKELTQLIEDLEMPEEALEIRLRFIQGCDFVTAGAKILKDFAAHVETLSFANVAPNNYEGCRVSFGENHGDGWALLRMSLHDPILPINVESNVKHGAFKIVKELYYFLKKYPTLELAPLEGCIEGCREKLLSEVKEAKTNNQLNFLF